MSTNAVNPECFGHIRMSHYARCELGTYGCMRKHAATHSVGGAKFAAAVEALPDPGTNVLASAVPRTPEALHCPFCGGPR